MIFGLFFFSFIGLSGQDFFFIVFLKMHLSQSFGSFLSKEFGLFEAGAAAWTTDPWGLLTRELHW